jgi:hypothetical protein
MVGVIFIVQGGNLWGLALDDMMAIRSVPAKQVEGLS